MILNDSFWWTNCDTPWWSISRLTDENGRLDKFHRLQQIETFKSWKRLDFDENQNDDITEMVMMTWCWQLLMTESIKMMTLMIMITTTMMMIIVKTMGDINHVVSYDNYDDVDQNNDDDDDVDCDIDYRWYNQGLS